MCERLIAAELHDDFGEIGFVGPDAFALQRLVELDFLRGHGLDLDDLVAAVLLHQADDDAVGVVGIGGPVDLPARRGAGLLELRQVVVEMAHACAP